VCVRACAAAVVVVVVPNAEGFPMFQQTLQLLSSGLMTLGGVLVALI
jgi:hypothetical protein